MTLFLTAATDNALFQDALRKHFDGKPDQLTLDLLAQQQSSLPLTLTDTISLNNGTRAES
jgi:hypothetical protein